MKKIKIYINIFLFLILLLNVLLITYDHKHPINLIPLMAINAITIIAFIYFSWVSIQAEKEEDPIYIHEHSGIRYFIYDRQPDIGELTCTWYPDKEYKVRHNLLLLSVFIFDEAAAKSAFDYKTVKTEVI